MFRSKVTLTVNSQAEGFTGLGVEVGVLGHAGVVASVASEDLIDSDEWSCVHF